MKGVVDVDSGVGCIEDVELLVREYIHPQEMSVRTRKCYTSSCRCSINKSELSSIKSNLIISLKHIRDINGNVSEM